MQVFTLMLYFLLTQLQLIKTNKIYLKQNILLIFVDDLRFIENENVHLPNIEKMAEKGATFKNAFAQQALCAPSRNSILTGRRPDTLRLYDFYSYWRTFSGNYTTLPQYFKQNGYSTFSVGKIFHPGLSSNFNDDYPYSWSYVPYHPPTETYKDFAVCHDPVTKKLQKNLVCPVNIEKQPGKTLPDLQSLEQAINFMKNNRTKPFFLAVGFHKPHIPLKFPKKYLKKVPIETIHPPKHPEKPPGMPLVAWHPWTDVRRRDDIKILNISFPMGTLPQKWALKIKQSYFAAATYVDDLIGQLMSHVDERNTITVLTSDHGWSLGENGMWAKYSNFDVALKVPLIFSKANISPKVIYSPVELVDIFPTLVDLAGLPKVPKCLYKDTSVLCNEGKSLIPLIYPNMIRKQSIEFAISQYPRPGVHPNVNTDKPRLKDIKIMGYSVRTKRYRYTEWISFNSTSFTRNWNNIHGIELYDHLTDPDESNNLNTSLQYKYIKIYLSKLLRSQVDPNKRTYGNFG